MAAGLLSRRVKMFNVKGSNCGFSDVFWVGGGGGEGGGGWPQDCIP